MQPFGQEFISQKIRLSRKYCKYNNQKIVIVELYIHEKKNFNAGK